MLTDVKLLLERTNMKVAEICFMKAPALPYIVFLSNEHKRGSDEKNMLIERDITIEFYSDKINKSKEKLIENLLDEICVEYTKNRIWINTEDVFQTVYDFSLLEKI